MSTHTINTNILIIGAGAGGVSVAARLQKKGIKEIYLLDPSEKHYYQPAWTLVGAGILPKEETSRDQISVIPKGVHWIKTKAKNLHPEQNYILTKCNKKIHYNYLVMAPGIQLNWHKIKGLEESLGNKSVCSNYSYTEAEYTWEALQATTSGTALFTMPATPIKCAGAPQKIMYLADAYFRKQSTRENIKIIGAFAPPAIFGIEAYKKPLENIIKRQNIDFKPKHDLVAIDSEKKVASFKTTDTGEQKDIAYNFIHVTPPMSAPDFIKNSALAIKDNPLGWCSVDKHTLQSPDFSNVFGLGDATNTPNSKTAAAIRMQAPVLVKNLLNHMESKPLTEKYNGYASCPLVTDYGKVLLAEFDYSGLPTPSFPLDPTKERFIYYKLKKNLLPVLYWHGMLKGRA